MRYFAKFPPTRTQNFLRRGAVAPWPYPGATPESSSFIVNCTDYKLSFSRQLVTRILLLNFRCIPKDEPIDLLNVAFEQKSRQQNKTRGTKKEVELVRDPYDVPDRETGRAGVKELNPDRTWNFIEVCYSFSGVTLLPIR